MVLGAAVVDELVTGLIVLETKLLLVVGVMNLTDGFETDDCVLMAKLELFREGIVLGVEIGNRDELVKGKTTLALDVRRELGVVEMTEEFEIG